MKETRLAYLFQAYFEKRASSGERAELMELLARSEHDEAIKLLLKDTWLQLNTDNRIFTNREEEEMLTRIFSGPKAIAPVVGITPTPYKKMLRVSAVAALLLVLLTGIYLWIIHQPPVPSPLQADTTPKNVKDSIVPGGNKAVLTLADGSSITLDSTHVGTLVKQGNAKVVNLNNAILAYNAGNDNSQETVYNTLSTFSGGQYHVVLSDGTKVWLNASSSIYYPTTFKGNERNVTVTGEAYFEVAKNASMPFTVRVKDLEVKVLGTHFNIMAYDDESSINTTLLEGSVKIFKGENIKMLLPGQESRVNKSGAIKITAADTEEVMAWKNGWFQFNAYDIQKVMRQVSRWYDVEVEFEGKIPVGHFTGSVNRENNISRVLKIMEAGGVEFRIEGRKVIVSAGKSNSS